MDRSTIGKELLEIIARSLVSNPDDVRVVSKIDERGVLLELHVNREDLGRIIGKGGDVAQAIKLILKTLGKNYDAFYSVKIIDHE